MSYVSISLATGGTRAPSMELYFGWSAFLNQVLKSSAFFLNDSVRFGKVERESIALNLSRTPAMKPLEVSEGEIPACAKASATAAAAAFTSLT